MLGSRHPALLLPSPFSSPFHDFSLFRTFFFALVFSLQKSLSTRKKTAVHGLYCLLRPPSRCRFCGSSHVSCLYTWHIVLLHTSAVTLYSAYQLRQLTATASVVIAPSMPTRDTKIPSIRSYLYLARGVACRSCRQSRTLRWSTPR